MSEKTKEDFFFSLSLSRETLADHLEALAKSFRIGKVSFTDGNETVQMDPEGDLAMDVHAHTEGMYNKLSMKFRWQTKPKNRQDLQFHFDDENEEE